MIPTHSPPSSPLDPASLPSLTHPFPPPYGLCSFQAVPRHPLARSPSVFSIVIKTTSLKASIKLSTVNWEPEHHPSGYDGWWQHHSPFPPNCRRRSKNSGSLGRSAFLFGPHDSGNTGDAEFQTSSSGIAFLLRAIVGLLFNVIFQFTDDSSGSLKYQIVWFSVGLWRTKQTLIYNPNSTSWDTHYDYFDDFTVTPPI